MEPTVQPTFCALYYRELAARKRAQHLGEPVPVPAAKPGEPTNCALYWREYNARKCVEDATWVERRRQNSALAARRKYIAKMEALGRTVKPTTDGTSRGRPRKY